MSHYKVKEGRLKIISEVRYKLEKEIQALLENNLEVSLDLQFVRSEFPLHNMRVDTLAFDKLSNAFVIIEYKQGQQFSVIDQGFAYLALMLNNKADFVLEYNERTGNQIKKKDVDWSQSRVVFISQSFTTFQKEAISFKDLPIELWEIKRYRDDTVSLNQLIATNSSESIKTISKSGTNAEKVSQEVKKYTEDDHLSGVSDSVLQLYEKFKSMVLNFSDGIVIRPRKLYIGFVAKRNFTDLVLQSSKIKIFLNLKKGTLDDPKNIARDISKIGHWGNGDYEINLSDDTNLEYVISLIKQSFLKNEK